MKTFNWEKDPFNHYKCIKMFTDNYFAAGVFCYRQGYTIVYGGDVYIVGEDKKSKRCKTLEEAKEYCDKELLDAGIKTLEDQYKVLL